MSVAAVVAASLMTRPAGAASLMIWPVNPVISPGKSGTTIAIENRGKGDVVLQIRALRWQQTLGEEQLTEEDSLIVSPPITRVASGTRQVVRLVLAESSAQFAERGYRVLVDEIPAALGSDDDPAANAIRFRMRYSLPLFVYGDDAALENAEEVAAALRCTVDPAKRTLTIENAGRTHARLSAVTLEAGGQFWKLVDGLLGYVLPESRMSWQLPQDAPFQTSLRAIVNEGDTQTLLGECTTG